MEKVKKMFGVERAYIDGRQTYEIFPSLIGAENFCRESDIWNDEHIPLWIFSADFNSELIFFDELANGWNYEDYSDTILGNYQITKGRF